MSRQPKFSGRRQDLEHKKKVKILEVVLGSAEEQHGTSFQRRIK